MVGSQSKWLAHTGFKNYSIKQGLADKSIWCILGCFVLLLCDFPVQFPEGCSLSTCVMPSHSSSLEVLWPACMNTFRAVKNRQDWNYMSANLRGNGRRYCNFFLFYVIRPKGFFFPLSSGNRNRFYRRSILSWLVLAPIWILSVCSACHESHLRRVKVILLFVFY